MREEMQKEKEGHSFMDSVYKAFFGKYLQRIERVTEDNPASHELQKLGIDVVLHLSWTFNGIGFTDEVKIDEKIRPVKWNDFIVEIYSDTERKTPSWIFKPGADYIAYAFMETKECYFLQRLMLLLWTCGNKDYLELECEKKEVENERGLRKWVTTSYIVPKRKLLAGLSNIQYIRLY